MLRPIKSPIIVFLFAISVMVVFSPFVSAEETYIFERMWPSLQQPWYFDPFGIAMDGDQNIYITDSINEKVVKLNSEGQLITEWKSENEYGEPWMPGGIAISDNQHVYVADRRHNCIKKFTLNGQSITEWGSPGSGEGQFNFFDNESDTDGGYVAVDAVGNVYVADTLNHRIQKFKPGGDYMKQWGSFGTGDGQFNAPAALTIDAGGNVYVVDGYNDRIQKFTLEGVFITKWGSHGDAPGQFNFWKHRQEENLGTTGITIDNDGNIVVVDNENYRIQIFDPDGNFLSMWGGITTHGLILDSPRCIAVDPSGNMYVGDGSETIYKFTADGVLLTQWGSSGNGNGEFRKPLGIGSDDSGNVYVADHLRIQKFTPTGQFIDQIDTSGDHYWSAWGMTVDGDGIVYAIGNSATSSNVGEPIELCEIEECEHSVKKFDANGVEVAEWGEYGSGPGQFIIWDKPTGIALDGDGNVYVIDTGNDRIQKFDKNGGYIAQWGTHGTGVGQFDFLLKYGAGIAIDQEREFVYVVGGGGTETPEGLAKERVQKFDLNGNPLLEWDRYGPSPYEVFLSIHAVTVDNDGNVLVDFLPSLESSYSGAIIKFTSDGEVMAEYLEPGSAPGQVIRFHDMTIDATGRLYVADSDFNRVQAFKKVDTLPNDRAIVVAGGGPYPGNNLWDATQMCANFAYRTMTLQGYTKQNIFYLTSDTDLDLDNNGELDDVDEDATNANLQQAVTNWAAGAESLVLYLVDHGGEHTFRMSGTETLAADDLNTWLNTLQASMTGNLIVVYDACESGTFQAALTPPAGKKRMVITSTSPGESAYFVSQGMVSFSSYFWTHIFNGSHVGEAFDLAKASIEVTTSYQHPQMNTGGISGDVYIGSGNEVSGDDPVIGGVSQDQLITDTNTATIWASDVTDDDGISRVWATIRPPDYNQGSSDNPVQNLPSVEFLPVGGDRYEVTYEGFNIEGTYQLAIYARDRDGNTSVPSLTSVSVNSPLRRRAVILAGGSSSDSLWPAVKNCATFAYEALMFQGYTDADILFLSPDTSLSGADALSTLGNLSYAINIWAATETQDIVLYMVGNGRHEVFSINADEALTPEVLNTWLDRLQNLIPGKVTVIYDADFSGSFLPLLAPPQSKERIMLSSTDAHGPACFPVDGNISFSAFFWQRVLNGSNVRDAFVHTTNAVGYACQGQEPALDDSGNGLGNEPGLDGRLARYYTLGAGIILAGDEPLIGSICPVQELSGEESALIWVEDVTTTSIIDKVWAVIILQGEDTGGSLNPHGNVTSLQLSSAGDGRYEATYNGFTLFGTYSVSVYAMDDNGNVSQPKETQVDQKVGLDMYEEDDIFGRANIIALVDSLPQKHSFHDQGDQDWVKFYGIQSEPYEIKVNEVGSKCDVAIYVYDTNGTTILTQRNFGFEGEDEILDWNCPKTGIYYVMIQHFGTKVAGFGEDAEYELSMYRPIQGIFVLVKGIIKDFYTGVPIANTRIITSDNNSALSLPNGYYLMAHRPGIFTFSARAEESGYPLQIYSDVEVKEAFSITLDFIIEPDTDGDGIIDGEDGCPNDVKKIAFGICGCGEIDVATDTDKDGAADCIDDFINDPKEWLDSDADGVGNNADSDDDNDGIGDTMEATGPNGGDSNQDGVSDSLQNHVVSFQANTGHGFVIIESLSNTTLSNCQAAGNPSVDDMPAELDFRFGFFDFTINGLGPGGAGAITITLPENESPDTYYKYGMTPNNPSDHWYEFLYDFETGAQIIDNVIWLYFVDALRGDDILTQDSMVVDLGGPAFTITDDDGDGDSSGGGGGGGGCFVHLLADVSDSVLMATLHIFCLALLLIILRHRTRKG